MELGDDRVLCRYGDGFGAVRGWIRMDDLGCRDRRRSRSTERSYPTVCQNAAQRE